jgi:amidohydrolase
VISVTSIHAGETFNVIPPVVDLQGTIRTFEPAVRQQVLARFQQVTAGVGQALGCHVDVDLRSLTPAVTNDPEVSARVRETARRIFPESPIESNFRTMGSEDMAFFMQAAPSCFIFVGSANPARGLDAPHHHPRFDIDEDALPRAVALMASAAIDLLKN